MLVHFLFLLFLHFFFFLFELSLIDRSRLRLLSPIPIQRLMHILLLSFVIIIPLLLFLFITLLILTLRKIWLHHPVPPRTVETVDHLSPCEPCPALALYVGDCCINRSSWPMMIVLIIIFIILNPSRDNTIRVCVITTRENDCNF